MDGKLEDPSTPPKFPLLTIDGEFFVRQKYFSVEDIHVATLTPDDVSPETPCPCNPARNHPIYNPGEFVLVKERNRLQPCRFEFYDDTQAWVRKMERKREVDGTGKVNELVWTEIFVHVSPRRIVRKCCVVKIKDGEEIPQLVDWKGSSDWFFYREIKRENPRDNVIQSIHEEEPDTALSLEDVANEGNDAMYDCITLTTEAESTSLASPPAEISAASSSDVTQPVEMNTVDLHPDHIPEERKLRGLDLFCGGGNFGRGVADGGAVQHKWYT